LTTSLLDYKSAIKDYFYYYGGWKYLCISKYL
jgi:hypothetical protein